jgi:hypothetical protein
VFEEIDDEADPETQQLELLRKAMKKENEKA